MSLVCISCSKEKAMAEFYWRKDTLKYESSCKSCRSGQRRIRYANNPSKELAVNRSYAKTGRGARIMSEAVKRYNQTVRGKKMRVQATNRHNALYPEQRIAREEVRSAIKAGALIAMPCEVCGTEKADGHHEDYSKPLDVRWLCRLHHSNLHRGTLCLG